MSRFVAALAVLAFAFPATASAFSKEDKEIVVGPARLSVPLLAKPISR